MKIKERGFDDKILENIAMDLEFICGIEGKIFSLKNENKFSELEEKKIKESELRLKEIYHTLPKIKEWKEYEPLKKEYRNIGIYIHGLLKI